MKRNKFLNKIKNGSYIRTINYHNTPDHNKEQFEKQLKYFAEYFFSVNERELEIFLKEKKWNKNKPGLIIAMYNGYRNNYDIMYPLLKKYGFTGWFFVPSAFIDVDSQKQKIFAEQHTLQVIKDEYKDGRYAMNWSELREIAKNNVVGCHTKTHEEIIKTSTEKEMEREIVESKLDIEYEINKKVNSFCWLGGYRYNYNPEAAYFIKKAGYKFMFGNGIIERIQ
ncbi:MAG: polysaccharide deacetylase family protein [Halanaerobiales bacterium]|nr:polysaccharide deacetylase family protein [Halanaerobiales bacterium]